MEKTRLGIFCWMGRKVVKSLVRYQLGSYETGIVKVRW